ncbi:MAG TPA: dTMP kinase [Lactobacillaceae bacterium]|jgi:dTMP kinase
MEKGTFISFEGPEGAGKSSVLRAVTAALQERADVDLVTTREPGGSHIAEMIRNVILTPEEHGMDARTEALLYAAARRQHLVDVVLPALDAGQVVISDRYVDSSLAYQGGGRGLGVETVWEMNQFAMDGVLPDLTVYLDVPVEIGLARVARRREAANRLDNESLAFHNKVRDTYWELQQAQPDRIHIVDATQPLQTVIDTTLALIDATLANK